MHTPSTCSIQRASQRGSRGGHCSNTPNASCAQLATTNVRSIHTRAPVFEPMLISSPNSSATASVKRTRGHAKMRAKPRAGGAVGVMARL